MVSSSQISKLGQILQNSSQLNQPTSKTSSYKSTRNIKPNEIIYSTKNASFSKNPKDFTIKIQNYKSTHQPKPRKYGKQSRKLTFPINQSTKIG